MFRTSELCIIERLYQLRPCGDLVRERAGQAAPRDFVNVSADFERIEWTWACKQIKRALGHKPTVAP